MKHTLSVVVSAYNEAHTIGRCLSSVQFADELVVVDNESLDDTAKVARTFTKNVYRQKNLLMLNTNKNVGFSKATSDWILNLDADEVVPPELSKEILEVIQSNPKENGFWIARKNFSFGKWIKHGLWWPDKQLRLFRRNKGSFPCVHIHEYIEVDGEVSTLNTPYDHYNYESIHQYLTKIDRASTSEALSLKQSNYVLSWYDAFRFPVSDFLKIYFAQHGYRDGLHGLVLALFQAFYSFAVFAKYWEMNGFTDRDISSEEIALELKHNAKELKYWQLSMGIDESRSTVGKIHKKILRKLIK